ncbi:MAG: hypothetical protein IIA67_07515 [Planctomycetes bacterium]|nr:hypothetical protein [Planctomycetota bacterium]
MNRLAFAFALPLALAGNTLLLCAPAIAIEGSALLVEPGVLLLLLLSHLLIVVESTATNSSGTTRRPSMRRDDVTARRLALASGAMLVAVFWAALIGRQPGSTALTCCGAFCFTGGILLRLAAARRLGRFFRTEVTITDQRFVCTGIYRHLRHPSETGLLLVGLGAGILLASPPAVVVWALALVPLTLLRIGLEERCLYGAFGAAYREYARSCRRLVPWVF